MSYRILEPAAFFRGKRNDLERRSDGVWSCGALLAEIAVTPVRPGADKIVSRWTNTGDGELFLQPEIRVASGFVYKSYLIPGVSYNGNGWGRGREPKGLCREGEPWIFEYRRTSLPSCTISENETEYMALMASDADEASLRSSCGMEAAADGTMIHRLLYPEIERPLTYSGRDAYAEPQEGFLRLGPHETFRAEAWILTGKPVFPRFAAANVEEEALALLGKPFTARFSTGEIKDLCSAFAFSLLQDVGGKRLFSIGLSLNEKNEFRLNEGNEFGWCGQNGMYARLFLRRWDETGDESYKSVAVGVLDAFAAVRGKTGLVHAHYDRWLKGSGDVEDTCNLGYAILEFALCWKFLHDRGEDHPEWLDAGRDTADYLIGQYSDVSGFGKAWNVETGECLDPEGTIGAYVIPGLAALYRITSEEKYLTYAGKALRLYAKRDLDEFRCTAGALDTYCIDKESSGPILRGALALYEIDGEKEWLVIAQKAGWYFTSWMFYYDALYPAESDFAHTGFRTRGATSVSAQHHHLDPWGALVVPDMLRLWKYTGDDGWKKRAELLFANAMQNVTPGCGRVFHDAKRGPGAQNEGYLHCRWGSEKAPGYCNDWLVAWPQAFLWHAAAEIEDMLRDP